MRKVISLMVIFIIIAGCQSPNTITPATQPSEQSAKPMPGSNEKLAVYQMKAAASPGSDAVVSLLHTITDKDRINVFLDAFETAEPMPGAVKMIFPPYKVVLGTAEYYLWIDEKKHGGSMMNLENTMKMYTLSESAAYKIKEILSWTEPQKPMDGIVVDKRTNGKYSELLVVSETNDSDSAWYIVDKDVFDKTDQGQKLAITSGRTQMESNPPIRVAITVSTQ
ncbi:hypothetical protein SD71_20410 [Cohnella kolymensis]|uniref:YhfM-like domain-containing protein n=1 Tax=Cohnella kolymensis TaxID=1590652 RepID=A0ABR5A0C5_9BACL|nr:hypothetical protein [Cohnella kolymensis]KIL34387.1 hypothetical protein SD71_20410 [Cohnella kolymensis]